MGGSSSGNAGNEFDYSLEFDIDSGATTSKSSADLYNPGFTPGDSFNREGIVTPDGVHDISDSSRVTLGKYMSATTRGIIDPTHVSTFQQSPYNVSVGVQGAGVSVDLNVSRLLESTLAATQLQVEGRTFGTYLDVVAGTNPDAANEFGMTSHGSLASAVLDNIHIDTGKIGKIGKMIGTALGLGSEDGNVALLKVKAKGDSKTAILGVPTVVDDTPDGIIGNVLEQATDSLTGLLPFPSLQGSKIQRSVSKLLESNRFSPVERAFVQDHERTSTGVVLQQPMGAYATKDDTVDVDMVDLIRSAAILLGKPYEVKEDELKKIADDVLLNAVGSSPVRVPSLGVLSPADGTVNALGAEPRASGVPYIPVQNLRAGKNTKYSATEYVNPDERILSYGAINTPSEPFDGPVSPEPMFKIVATGFNAVLDAANQIRDLIRSQQTQPGTVGSPSTVGGLGFTRNRADPPSDGLGFIRRAPSNTPSPQDSEVMRILGIPKLAIPMSAMSGPPLHSPPVHFGWYECFMKGMETFFYVRLSSESVRLDVQNLPQSFKNRVSLAPGYFVPIARNSLRGAKQINETISSNGSSAASSDSARAAANKNLLSTISSSPTWKFVLAMISLGYRAKVGGSPFERDIDADPDERVANLSRRATQSDTISEMRHDFFVQKELTKYILPQSFLAGSNTYARSHESSELKPSFSVPGTPVYDSKIDSETVRKIENALEGEHMPFYFHDLRTNEVIAFHAFLTELGDSFSPTYTNTAAYGRGDEVMVYSNTKRAINFGFTLVAMSSDDMDLLYWNINKLVSMVYPQYSKGRLMVSGDQKFIQPFSQIPTASPMIRVRIGDMVKSNYSKFGLARLFGLGQENSFKAGKNAAQREVLNQARTENPQKAKQYVDALEKEMQRGKESALGKEVKSTRKFSSKFELLDENNVSAAFLTNAELRSLTAIHRNMVKHDTSFGFKGTIIGLGTDTVDGVDYNTYQIQILQFANTAAGIELQSAEALGKYIYCLVRAPVSVTLPTGDVIDDWGPFVFSRPQRETLYNEKLRELEQSTQAQVNSLNDENIAIKDFFDATNNPIVRSFESARGRGMAGFITSLNFDWADSTWDITPGKRGPMMMKATVQFSPIHDIPLGLDSDGAMRSVAYGVGEHSIGLGGDPYDRRPGSENEP